MTIPEVFYTAVMNAFKQRAHEKDSLYTMADYEQNDQIYTHLLSGNQGTLKRLIETRLESSPELRNSPTLK